MQEPPDAGQRPMGQGGLSDWLYSRQPKTNEQDAEAQISDLPEIRNPELLKYKRTHVDYYVVLNGDKPPEMDKNEAFKIWAEENGIIWPKVEWPVEFAEDYWGCRVTSEIAHREAFSMTPFKLVISCRRTREHPVLGKICKAYPACFEEGKSDDWEQLTLALAVLYEMTLGLKSKWYPYLRILPEDSRNLLPCFWREHELETFQDEGLLLELEGFKTEMHFYCDLFMKIMDEHPHVFPK